MGEHRNIKSLTTDRGVSPYTGMTMRLAGNWANVAYYVGRGTQSGREVHLTSNKMSAADLQELL